MKLHRSSRRGLAILVTAVCVTLLVLIHAYSSWYVGLNLAHEVAAAEASQCLHLVVDSAIEESVEGFVRSAAIRKADDLTPEEEAALAFGNRMRNLRPGEAARTRFVPRNTRKSAGPLGVEVKFVSLRAFQESAKAQVGKPSSEQCEKLNAVFDKWSKVSG
jgi:hypothetical protein